MNELTCDDSPPLTKFHSLTGVYEISLPPLHNKAYEWDKNNGQNKFDIHELG